MFKSQARGTKMTSTTWLIVGLQEVKCEQKE